MKLVKRTVYLPVNGEQDKVVCNDYPDWMDRITGVLEQEGYFFTQEELNEYTQSVIKQALETAAKKAECCEDAIVDIGHTIIEAYVEKKSITNTFDETFKKFEV